MTSLRQIETNRQNAAKSTGPRTSGGKAVAARNAERHGLRSRGVLLKSESENEFADFSEHLRAQLAPETEFEHFLVSRMVWTGWRLRRVLSVESALFDGEKTPAEVLRNGLKRMQLLSRYEVTLERSLYKALHELQRFQAARAGMAVPLPEAVDVEINVSGASEMRKLGSFGKNANID